MSRAGVAPPRTHAPRAPQAPVNSSKLPLLHLLEDPLGLRRRLLGPQPERVIELARVLRLGGLLGGVLPDQCGELGIVLLTHRSLLGRGVREKDSQGRTGGWKNPSSR